MNFRQGANLDMAGSGAGLIKGALRSRMERVLLEDDDQMKEKQVSNPTKDRKRTQQMPMQSFRDEKRDKKRY